MRPKLPKPKRLSKPKPRPLPASMTPLSLELYAIVYAAAPRLLAPDLRDDMVHDMIEAVLDCRTAVEQIAAEAPGFARRTANAFADRWGARSVDEEIGEDGFTLGDVLEDESAPAEIDRVLEQAFAE